MEEQEQHYIKGFNNGYLLAKHEPSLIDKVVKDLHPTNDYLEGFFSGKKEFELENSRAQLDDLTNLRNQYKSRETDLERDE